MHSNKFNNSNNNNKQSMTFKSNQMPQNTYNNENFIPYNNSYYNGGNQKNAYSNNTNMNQFNNNNNNNTGNYSNANNNKYRSNQMPRLSIVRA